MQVFAHSTQMLAVGRAVAAREGSAREGASALYKLQCNGDDGIGVIANSCQSNGTEVLFTRPQLMFKFPASSSGGGLFGRRRLARVPTLFNFGGVSPKVWRRTPS